MTVDITLKKAVDNSYEIVIDALPQLSFNRKVAIVTNPKVAGLHLKYLLEHLDADELYIITVPDGEMYKNQESIDIIVGRLFDHRFNRNSLLIAFGGGVMLMRLSAAAANSGPAAGTFGRSNSSKKR